MITFAGVVTLEDGRVPVTIGLDEDEVTLISGHVEIGKWPAGDCTFVGNGDGSWVLEADDGSVSFRPDDPTQFEKGLAGQLGLETAQTDAGVTVPHGSPPRPWTMVGFVAMGLVTAALGVWAFITVVT